MSSASEQNQIRTQSPISVRRERVIKIIWLLYCCCVVAKSDSSSTPDNLGDTKSNDKSTYKNRSYASESIHNSNDPKATDNADNVDELTTDEMIMYGFGAVPGFEDIGRDGIGTTKVLSTSESSRAGLASIAGGFDHASFEPHYEYSPVDRTPPTTGNGQEGSVRNSSYQSPDSDFQQYVNQYEQRIKCGHFTLTTEGKSTGKSTIKAAEPCRFWAEGVISTVVAIFGFMGNLISIWVLSDQELRSSAFNRLLLALAIIDCMFIMPGTVIYTAKAFSWEADWYNRSFPVFLYPFTEIALCSSIYMTLAIAVERYFGLCRPFQRLSGSCSAKTYITPVVLIAMLLNIPKFLESETTYRLNKENNTTMTSIGVTNLRLNPDYITYYWMWTRLFTTGVVPFILLALLNSKIYLAIRKSKQQLRALAIRSALPMAILGAKNAAGATAGVSAPETLVPELAGINLSTALISSSSDNGHKNGHKKTTKPVSGTIGSPNSSYPSSVACKSPPSQKFHNLSPKNILYIKNGEASLVNGSSQITASTIGHKNGSPKSPSSPRFIQRSMSAFVSSDTNNRQIRHSSPNRNGSSDLNPLGRSYSTAATVTHTTNNSTQQTQTPAALSNYSSNDNLAPILFGVVIVFVICNSLRVILNIYDSSVVEDIIKCEKQKMGRYPPPWILCTISVSHLLLMVNSSVNFLVYCVAGKRFRSILTRKIRKKFRAIRKLMHCCSEERRQQQSYFTYRSHSQTTTTNHLNNALEGTGSSNGYKKAHRHLLLKHTSSPDTLLSLQNPQKFSQK